MSAHLTDVMCVLVSGGHAALLDSQKCLLWVSFARAVVGCGFVWVRRRRRLYALLAVICVSSIVM